MLLWTRALLVRQATRRASTRPSIKPRSTQDAGQFEQALEWLSEAEDLAGGLPDAYRELRERWISYLAPLAVVVRRR